LKSSWNTSKKIKLNKNKQKPVASLRSKYTIFAKPLQKYLEQYKTNPEFFDYSLINEVSKLDHISDGDDDDMHLFDEHDVDSYEDTSDDSSSSEASDSSDNSLSEDLDDHGFESDIPEKNGSKVNFNRSIYIFDKPMSWNEAFDISSTTVQKIEALVGSKLALRELFSIVFERFLQFHQLDLHMNREAIADIIQSSYGLSFYWPETKFAGCADLSEVLIDERNRDIWQIPIINRFFNREMFETKLNLANQNDVWKLCSSVLSSHCIIISMFHALNDYSMIETHIKSNEPVEESVSASSSKILSKMKMLSSGEVNHDIIMKLYREILTKSNLKSKGIESDDCDHLSVLLDAALSINDDNLVCSISRTLCEYLMQYNNNPSLTKLLFIMYLHDTYAKTLIASPDFIAIEEMHEKVFAFVDKESDLSHETTSNHSKLTSIAFSISNHLEFLSTNIFMILVNAANQEYDYVTQMELLTPLVAFLLQQIHILLRILKDATVVDDELLYLLYHPYLMILQIIHMMPDSSLVDLLNSIDKEYISLGLADKDDPLKFIARLATICQKHASSNRKLEATIYYLRALLVRGHSYSVVKYIEANELQSQIENNGQSHIQILYNYLLLQLVIVSAQNGQFEITHPILSDSYIFTRPRDYLAKTYLLRVDRSNDDKRDMRRRSILPHQIVPLDQIDAVYTLSTMFPLIPVLVSQNFLGTPLIPRPFKRLLDNTARNLPMLEPAGFRPDCLAAVLKLTEYDWKECLNVIAEIDVWNPTQEAARQYQKYVKIAALLTMLYSNIAHIKSYKYTRLAERFELQESEVRTLMEKLRATDRLPIELSVLNKILV